MIKNGNVMKAKILFILLVLIGSTSSMFATSKQGQNQGSGDVGDGGLMIYSRAASLPSLAIEVMPKDDIQLLFSADIGIIYATIKSNTGVVVSSLKLDTSEDAYLRINIANFLTGSYTLIITDGQGAIIKTKIFTVD